MRRQVHLLIGAMAYLAYTYLLHLLVAIPAEAMLAGLPAALLGSVMPDIIDPPGRWNHRRSGHSRRALRYAAALFAAAALASLFQAFDPDLSLCFVLSGFFLGYTLHLLADGITPAGLPG